MTTWPSGWCGRSPTRGGPASPLKQFLESAGWANWAAAVGLVVLIIIFEITDTTFLTNGNTRAIMLAAAIPSVLAVGQTFVIATAGIDLSMASAMTFGAVMLGQTYAAGWPMAACCVLAVATGGAVGLANGLIIAKGRVTDFIVTLGTLSAASAAALILSGGNPVTVISPFLLRLATGSIGGSLVYPIIGAAEPATDTTYRLNAIAAVVLGGVSLFGGRGTILGPVFGALLLTVLLNGLTLLGVSEFYQPLAVGVAVVAAALIMRFQK